MFEDFGEAAIALHFASMLMALGDKVQAERRFELLQGEATGILYVFF